MDIFLLIIIIIQLFIIINRLPKRERDYVAEALERDRIAREQKKEEEKI